MADKKGVNFTAREMETLALAWQCFETDPKVNYSRLAELGGWTEGSAKTIMGNPRRKLKDHFNNITPGAGNGNGSGSGTSTPKGTPKKGGRPRKRDNPDGDESPSKKTKATPKKGKKLVDDDDDEFALPKIKKEELGDIVNDADAFYQQPVATTERAGMMASGGGLDLGDHSSCSGPHGLIDMDDDDGDNY